MIHSVMRIAQRTSQFLFLVFLSDSGEVTTSRCEMFAFEELLNGSILIRNDSRVRCSNWEYDRGTHTNTLTNQVCYLTRALLIGTQNFVL